MNEKSFQELSSQIYLWADERNLLQPGNHKNQALKMVSEVGELCDSIIKKNNPGIVDGIGDTLVTIIILCEQLKLDPVECLSVAYKEIANRKGKTVNGTFVKFERNSDL